VAGLHDFLMARMVAPTLLQGKPDVPVEQLNGSQRLVGTGTEFVLAIDALGSIGPDAAPTTDLLLQLVGDHTPERARSAVNALVNHRQENLARTGEGGPQGEPRGAQPLSRRAAGPRL